MRVSVVPNCSGGNDSKILTSNEIISVVDIESLGDLAQLGLEFNIATGIFKNNQRSNSNLIEQWFVLYDFDDGSTTSHKVHIDLLTDNIRHLILGSKNHKKDKGDGSGPIERFHLFLPIDQPVTSDKLYKIAVQELIRRYGWSVDKSCKDAARYFAKHSSQLYIHDEKWGRFLKLADFTELEQKQKQEREREQQSQHRTTAPIFGDAWEIFKKAKCRTGTTLPIETCYYDYVLNGGLKADGQRHPVAMATIGCAKKCGVSRGDIESFIVENSVWGQRYTRRAVEKILDRLY